MASVYSPVRSPAPPVISTASTPSLRSREAVPIQMPKVDPGSGHVRVVVRVRGFLQREIERGAECLIEMDPDSQATRLLVPGSIDPANARTNTRKVTEQKSFTFDNSFWSHKKEDEHYANQEHIYSLLGEEFLDHNFEGYHTCIFAYGQTGSGKSYTMMGTRDQPGLIPRTCADLFERIASNTSPSISYSVRVSYFEVYNEHVRDLLIPRQDPPYYLKIRESPTEGPYVKDLTEVQVRNIGEIMKHMTSGDNNRTTASTKMNDTSSRSHSVFTIVLKQIQHDMDTDETTERLARIRLVDLAGSERAKSTEATGQRLREGSNINKSLTTLGRVIAALADSRSSRPGGSRKRDIVPYRDSILTWLLKDSLGGNSKTAMIACIAPSDYEETLSTLRYADQAKHIRTRAIVNQDHLSAAARDAQIAEMQETIRNLQLNVSQQAVAKRQNDMQSAQLEEYQMKVDQMQRLMEETRQVSECKIRALQTENEALRLHLKLALDSLKNPIKVAKPLGEITASRKNSRAFQEIEKENTPPPEYFGNYESPDPKKDRKSFVEVTEHAVADADPDLSDSDESDGEDIRNTRQHVTEVHNEVEELLADLGLFRKKLRDDQSRFLPLSEKTL